MSNVISLLLDFFSHVMIGGGEGRGGICLLKTWYDTSKRTTCLVPCLVLHRFHCTKSEHLLLHVWNKQVHNIILTTVNIKAHIITRKTSPRSKHFREAGEQETAEERNSVSVVCLTPSFFLWLSPHFSRGQNTEYPVSWSFFTPQLHGNACYAGKRNTENIREPVT